MKAFALVLACLALPLAAAGAPVPVGPAAGKPPAGVVLEHVRRGGLERLADGESLRRYTFEPSPQPLIRMTPAQPWAGTGAQPPADGDARLLEWPIELPDAASVDAAAASLANAGHAAEREHGELVTRDPWGTQLRVRVAA